MTVSVLRRDRAPRPRRTRLLVAVALALFGVALPAAAQTPQCDRYRAELASLEAERNSGAGREFEAAAQRQQGELRRTQDYARTIGCDRQQFLFFGEPPPPQCGQLRARIQQMQANLQQLMARADQGGIESRRRFLIAALNQNCSAAALQQAARPRGFFEQLFGGPNPTPGDGNYPPYPDGQPLPNEFDEPRLGGNRLVCVRTCDGFFFPLSVSPGGRAGANEMCQALCPGAQAEAFTMGDQINGAVSLRGTPYMSLPNALRYTRTFDESCSCKRPDQNWAQSLRDAEALLDRRKTDIYVTEQKAEELSRAQPARAPANDPKRQAARTRAEQAAQAQVQAEAASEAATGAQAPTASQDSSGIGPQTISGSRVYGTDAGQKREIVMPDGEKRVVRVIGTGNAPATAPVQ